MSLHKELKHLFSKAVIHQAQSISPGAVDALAVHEAAGALLRLRGDEVAQVSYVGSMNQTTAAALYKWMAEPKFWVQVGNVATH